MELGGFEYLLNAFISLDVKKIETNLTLKCIEHLIMALYDFITVDKNLISEIQKAKQLFVTKIINLVDLISDFTISLETKRGESYEEINKRI